MIAAAGGCSAACVERLLDRRRLQDLEARVAQDDPQRPQDLRLVVDHQDARSFMQAEPTMPGRYRIFLGMAAGVGKTYRMLAEAQAEAEAGRDVVDRAARDARARRDRAAAAAGLEQLPRRRVPIAACALEEMDLPGDPRPRSPSCA